VFITVGNKVQRESVSTELQKNPLMCGNFETKEVEFEKWLGQLISAEGLADSVAKTVAAREGKIKAACLEIAQIVIDWRLQVVGGMETALLLWEACCIPSYLSGAGTWVEISQQTENKLNAMQYWFIRLILQVGPGAPKASLLWDFGVMDMGLRVSIEKVMLAYHVINLEEETLAKRVYIEQCSNEWPGLAKEVGEICQELGVESVVKTTLSKAAYRTRLIKAANLKNEEIIKKQSDGKVKCERISREDYGKKDYIVNENITRVREKYKARFGMQPCAGNFSNDKRFASTNWLCRCKREKEEEPHLLSGNCEVYGEIRQKYGDLKDVDSLVDFFNEVLALRDELDAKK
jgi:hypothetical protein